MSTVACEAGAAPWALDLSVVLALLLFWALGPMFGDRHSLRGRSGALGGAGFECEVPAKLGWKASKELALTSGGMAVFPGQAGMSSPDCWRASLTSCRFIQSSQECVSKVHRALDSAWRCHHCASQLCPETSAKVTLAPLRGWE